MRCLLLLLAAHAVLSLSLLLLGEAIRSVDRENQPTWSLQKIGQLAREWAGYFLVPLSWLMILLPQPQVRPSDGEGPPIIMVPGYALNSGSLWGLATYLRRQTGRTVVVVNNRPISAPVPVYARKLSQTIDAVLRQSGAKQVDLVGHSMGGIICAWAVNRMESAPQVRKLVTLGSPWKGTKYAALGHLVQARDLLPGSSVIQDVQQPATAVTAIWSDADHLLIPITSGTTEGTESVELEMVGHMDMLMSMQTYSTVLQALTEEAIVGPSD